MIKKLSLRKNTDIWGKITSASSALAIFAIMFQDYSKYEF